MTMTLTRPGRQKIVVALLVCVAVTLELLWASLVITEPESGKALALGVFEAAVSVATLAATVVLAVRPSRAWVRCLRTLLVVGGLLASPLLLVFVIYFQIFVLPALVVVGGTFVFSVAWASKFLVPNSLPPVPDGA